MFMTDTPDREFAKAYRSGLEHAAAVLDPVICEIEECSLGDDAAENASDQLAPIEKLCLRFHAAARQLQNRHGGRDALTINDEYDVQDLLHAILRLRFGDVRPEEYSPS